MGMHFSLVQYQQRLPLSRVRLYLSFKDRPNHAIFVQTLNVEGLKDAIFHHRNPSFQSFRIDDDFFVILVFLSAEKSEDTLANRTIFCPLQSGVLSSFLSIKIGGFSKGAELKSFSGKSLPDS